MGFNPKILPSSPAVSFSGALEPEIGFQILELIREFEQILRQIRGIRSPHINAAGISKINALKIKQADDFLCDKPVIEPRDIEFKAKFFEEGNYFFPVFHNHSPQWRNLHSQAFVLFHSSCPSGVMI